jgi:hypothetical protein
VTLTGSSKFLTLVSLLFSVRRRLWAGAVIAASALSATSCATIEGGSGALRLRETAGLIEEVKSFGKTLGIEPTQALSRTTREEPALSMLWLWMQREGTLALGAPVDIRLAIGYGAERERIKIEHVYRVDRYSVYYRQGNEFADARSVATIGFTEEPIVRRVKVVLHEDLHGDVNFAFPWEVEEAIVTPLASLAAVEYFRWKGDEKNLQNAAAWVNEERRISRELNALVARAEKIFALEGNIETAKQRVLSLLPDYPAYQGPFERQIRSQHAPTALEAKLSHDLAYYRYFDIVAGLAEKAPSLKTLIEDLKRLPREATPTVADGFLQKLNIKYGAAGR